MSEQLLVDMMKCGAGLGEHCCAYVLVGAEGPECGRVTPLRESLKESAEQGQMTARRLPEEDYPECQLSELERDAIRDDK